MGLLEAPGHSNSLHTLTAEIPLFWRFPPYINSCGGPLGQIPVATPGALRKLSAAGLDACLREDMS